MTITEIFSIVTERGKYRVGYLMDGWTHEFSCEAGSPAEAMMVTQNFLGNILDVTYVERC